MSGSDRDRDQIESGDVRGTMVMAVVTSDIEYSTVQLVRSGDWIGSPYVGSILIRSEGLVDDNV